VNLLGLDTSTAAAAACVLCDNGEAFEVAPDPTDLARPPAHATDLMPAVAKVMDAAGLDWNELDAIAVGVGPGSFTGLRIGVTTARALATASGLAIRPVSSLAALAKGIEVTASDTVVLPLIDAKRGEVFAAAYDFRSSHEAEREIWPPFTARPEELAERVTSADFTPLAAGDGSLRFRRVLETAGIRVAPEDSGAHVVRALHVCRLAATVPGQPPEAVLPEYLRAPDATPR
jgi:tRNA threonylcarbamoyladenosine biosynthesis protein TsaB